MPRVWFNAATIVLFAAALLAPSVDQIVRTNTGSSTTWYVRVYYYAGNTGASGTYTLGLSQ